MSDGKELYWERKRLHLCILCGAPVSTRRSGRPYAHCDEHRAMRRERSRKERELARKNRWCLHCKTPVTPNDEGEYPLRCERHALRNVRSTAEIRKDHIRDRRCTQCAARLPSGSPYQMCSSCKADVESRIRALKSGRISSGKCANCGEPRPAEGRSGRLCDGCAERAAEAKKRLDRVRREEGLCVVCGKPAVRKDDGSAMQYCQRHRDMRAESQRKRDARRREKGHAADD